MMIVKIKYYAFSFLLVLYSGVACAFWPNVPVPPQSTEQPLADAFIHNGIENRITQFNSRLLVREVLSFYRNKWSDKFSESVSEPWQQISRLEGKYFINVQVQQGISGSNGRITVTALPNKMPKVGVGTEMMTDTKILKEVITKDKNSISTVTLLMNRHTVEDNKTFYITRYTQTGWKMLMNKDMTQYQAGISLIFKKDADEINITINKVENMTTCLLNSVEKRNWFN